MKYYVLEAEVRGVHRQAIVTESTFEFEDSDPSRFFDNPHTNATLLGTVEVVDNDNVLNEEVFVSV